MAVDVASLVDSLRSTGGDCTNVEVKSAAGGFPKSLTSTLSAFANLPGGGIVILGVDERHGFRPVGLADPQKMKQALASQARLFTPPVQLTIEDGTLDNTTVVVAIVHECAPSAKPCRITADGAAYLRGYDGDFRMSQLEEQAFLAAREAPHFDRAAVPDATREDLDAELVVDFARTVRLRDRAGLGRFDGDELLKHAGVLTPDGVPTVAGLLTLGIYPQQWFPRWIIRAAAEPRPGDPPGMRARNQASITGPIPHMLDSALEWAEQNFDTAVLDQPDGTVRDAPAYPLLAFREVITNALVHRDLDQWSQGMAVEVRLRRDRLVVTNPGGLYGVTVENLGKNAVTSARNMWLVNICQYLRTPQSGGRVIEALATGIPTITHTLERAGLPPAHYTDMGIRFTVVLRPASHSPDMQSNAPTQTSTATTHSIKPHTPPDTTRGRGNSTEDRILEALTEGPRTVADLAPILGRHPSTVRKTLAALQRAGEVTRTGGRGRHTTYSLTNSGPRRAG